MKMMTTMIMWATIAVVATGAPTFSQDEDGNIAISGETTITTQTQKIFPNDPDIPEGLPMWSEWDITTQLLNLKDSKECSGGESTPLKKLTPGKIQYYYTDDDVSSCSEPGQSTCITRMYIPNELKHFGIVPYYVWYAFKNTGTLKKPVWKYDIWFNYNNTNTFKIGDTGICDGKSHVYPLDSCVFTPELKAYDLSVYKFAFDAKCKLDKKMKTLDFTIDQLTHNDQFKLVSFTNWTPFTGIVTPTTDYEYYTTSDTSGVFPESCKHC